MKMKNFKSFRRTIVNSSFSTTKTKLYIRVLHSIKGIIWSCLNWVKMTSLTMLLRLLSRVQITIEMIVARNRFKRKTHKICSTICGPHFASLDGLCSNHYAHILLKSNRSKYILRELCLRREFKQSHKKKTFQDTSIHASVMDRVRELERERNLSYAGWSLGMDIYRVINTQ